MTDEDICGSRNTATGEPCRNSPGCTIPRHNGAMTDGGGNRGPPTKFNDERAREAIDAARAIGAVRSAARAAGVTHPTMLNWLDDETKTYIDERGRERYFAAAFRRAQYERELELKTADDGDLEPSMARFWLASALGHRKTENLELTGSGGGAMEVIVNRERYDDTE